MINLSTSAFYDRAGRQIGVLRAEAEKLQQQVGTGQRLTRSSDDPVAAARLRTLERAERLSDIDQRNSDVATNDLAMADDALGSLANLVIRAQELATHAASETLSAEQREAIATEIDSLQDAALLSANGRNSAGHALFGGQASGVAYERDAGGVVYVGTGSREAMDLGDGQSVVPGLTGPEVFAFEVDGTPTDIFAVLGDLATGLRAAGDPAAASRDANSLPSAGRTSR